MRYFLIGDSHSQVIFPALKTLLSALGHQVQTVSKPGWSESKFLSDASTMQAISDAQPDAVVFALGGNNFDFSSKYVAYINQLLNRARIAGAQHIAWIGPFPSSKSDVALRHDKTRNMLSTALQSFPDVDFIDGYSLADVRSSQDGVHFDRSTYQRVAQAVFDILKKRVFAEDRPEQQPQQPPVRIENQGQEANYRTVMIAGVAAIWFLGFSFMVRKLKQKLS